LLDKGYDPEKVNNLTNVDAMDNETISDARDVDTIDDNYSNSIRANAASYNT
jgi:hypothetical protein